MESQSPKAFKPILKSSSCDQPTKTLRFNPEPEFYLEDDVCEQANSNKYDLSKSCASPNKRRKQEVSVPREINELEEEIENTLDSKARKSNLTATNVKNILRSVITNKYVVDMLRQTVQEGSITDIPYAPKLTRAKTKELLQHLPEASFPPVVGFLSPCKTDPPQLSPEMKSLINNELPEESSDEEYHPGCEGEQSEEDERGGTSMASDLDSMPNTPLSQAPDLYSSPNKIFKVPQENVGQRTRSKLSLNRLPLESLEQAFVPPDITQDMYEAECDNPDWHEFLKEFTQPLEINETFDDDPDSDPEYNVLEDERIIREDREEMRKDRAVKVSKRELKSLITELFEINGDDSSDEDTITQTRESIVELEKSILKETEDRLQREELERERLRKLEEKRRLRRRGFLTSQKYLLQQQLQQHVQLTTQHFLQVYEHPMYHPYADTCKTMLTTLSALRKDVWDQEILNIDAAMDTVAKWEATMAHPEEGKEIKTYVSNQISIEKDRRKRKKCSIAKFPTQMMQLVADSEVVLYPKLLPPLPFRVTLKATGPYTFTHSETMLVALSLEQVRQLMRRKKRRYKQYNMVKAAEVLMMTCLPRSNAHCIAAFIRKRKIQKYNNPIKYLFNTGKAPTIVHVVPFVQSGVRLVELLNKQLPEIWKEFITEEYENITPEPTTECTSITYSDSFCPQNDIGIEQKCHVLDVANDQLQLLDVKQCQDEEKYIFNETISNCSVEKELSSCTKQKRLNKSLAWNKKNVIKCKLKMFNKTDPNLIENNTGISLTPASSNVKESSKKRKVGKKGLLSEVYDEEEWILTSSSSLSMNISDSLPTYVKNTASVKRKSVKKRNYKKVSRLRCHKPKPPSTVKLKKLNKIKKG